MGDSRSKLSSRNDSACAGPLSAFLGEVDVLSVERFGDEFRLIVRGGGVEIAFWMGPANGQPCFMETANLRFSFEGDSIAGEAAALIEKISGLLAGASVEDLAEGLDWRSGGSTEGSSSGGDKTLDELLASSGEWGLTDRWKNFFLDTGAENNLLMDDSVIFREKSFLVHHTDIECMYVTPPSAIRFINYYNTFWGKRVHEPATNVYYTNLDERDVVMGGTEKIERLADRMASGNTPILANMVSCCVSMITDDDVEGAAERLMEKTGSHVFVTRQLEENVQAKVAWMIRGALEDAGAPGVEPAAGSFNLAGFGPERGVKELAAILESAGGRLNAHLYPEIDIDIIQRYPMARAQVFFPLEMCECIYAELERLPIEVVRPEAPFGLDASLRWARTVGRALGLPDALEAALAPVESAARREWEALRAEAAEYRLGFVVGPTQFQLLLSPEKFTGVPLLRLAEEMGFGIDLMIHPGHNSVNPDVSPILGMIETPGRMSVEYFNSQQELDALLRRSAPQAVYSGLFFDTRLTRAGKGQFSPRTFEPGVQGAVRSFRALLAACRLPFYKKYSHWLGK